MTPRRFTAEHSTIKHKGRNYDLLFVRWDDRSLQVSVSPAGRSVQVFLDHVKLDPLGEGT